MLVWLVAFLPVLGLLVNAVTQIVTCRFSPGGGLLRSVVVGFSASVAFVVACGAALLWQLDLTPSELLCQLAITTFTTATLGYGYFHFINLGETARRVRILYEFVEVNGALNADQLLQRYNAAEMVRKRLARLQGTGQVVFRDGNYYLRDRTVLRMAQIMETVRKILGMRPPA